MNLGYSKKTIPIGSSSIQGFTLYSQRGKREYMYAHTDALRQAFIKTLDPFQGALPCFMGDRGTQLVLPILQG